MLVSWFVIEWDPAEAETYPGGVVLRDAAGEILRVSLGPDGTDCRPTYVANTNDWIVKAVVASEDNRFFSHCGVSVRSVVRAVLQNVTGGRRVSGASTISMQTVRLIRPHRKGYLEKWAEAVRAVKMERRRDKLWILTQYLNRAPFGSNLVGIEAAAQGWFSKSASELGLGEAALLAGMVQAPSRFRPDRHPDRAVRRRDYVLGRMRVLGIVDAAQADAARSVAPVVRSSRRPFAAPHYCDHYLQRIARGSLGECAPSVGRDVATPLRPDVQKICEAAVDAAAREGGYAAAAIVREVSSGEIVALALSGDYFASPNGQVNTAFAPRPAGSTLKPFLTAFAMDLGLATPDERLADVPIVHPGYRPANFDNRYRGSVTLRDALVLSLNMPFLELARRVGVTRFADGLRGAGFAHLPEDVSRLGLGIVLGNAETTLAELTSAYRELARAASGERTSIVSPASAWLVSDVLSGAQRASAALGHVADVKTSRFAWKTGTSAAYRDAWTIAWNPEYVVGVWCGHLTGFGDASVVGAKAAAPRAWQIARALYPQNDGPWFREPAGVVHRRTCAASGLPAGPDCPETEETPALAGRSSPRLCGMHVRGFDGRPIVRTDPRIDAALGRAKRTDAFAIAKPENGATFRLVDGPARQRIVCAVDRKSDTRYWWYLDGKPVGETIGAAPFALEMTPGVHVLACATATGASAEVRFEVLR